MRRTRRRTAARRVIAAVPVVLAAMALASGPGAEVARADEGESITSFASTIDVDARGDLHVTETIEYAFAGTSHHGLQRELRTRVDEPGSDTDRLYPVSDVTTSSPTGAPARATVTDTGARTVVRVGDPERTVSGRQTYVLHYTVHGAFDQLVGTAADGADGEAPLRYDQLHWNATGDEWDVPIDRVSVQVTAPRPASAGWCFCSRLNSDRRCTDVIGSVSTFAMDGLQPRQGLLFTLVYPSGTVTDPRPVPAESGPVAAPSPEPRGALSVSGIVPILALVAAVTILAIGGATSSASSWSTSGSSGWPHSSASSGSSDCGFSDGGGGGGSSGGGSSW